MGNKTKERLASSGAMLLACWDLIKDLEKDYEVRIDQVWAPSGRRGVFLIVLSAYSEHPLDQGTKFESYGFYFPNSNAAPFETQLFRALNQLAIQLGSRPIPYRPS